MQDHLRMRSMMKARTKPLKKRSRTAQAVLDSGTQDYFVLTDEVSALKEAINDFDDAYNSRVLCFTGERQLRRRPDCESGMCKQYRGYPLYDRRQRANGGHLEILQRHCASVRDQHCKSSDIPWR